MAMPDTMALYRLISNHCFRNMYWKTIQQVMQKTKLYSKLTMINPISKYPMRISLGDEAIRDIPNDITNPTIRFGLFT